MHMQEGMKMHGVYTITKAKLKTPEQFALNARIVLERNRGWDVSALIKRLNSICETEVIKVENLLPTVGRAAIANQLTDATPSPDPLRINYVAVGTGTDAPANGDTTLQTESYRNLVASQTNSNNIAYVTMFLSATEDTGTYREVGLFIKGTASADSGTLFSRTAINITKSGTETLTIDWTLTIS